MRTFPHLRQYLAEFFLDSEMFKKKLYRKPNYTFNVL